MSVILSTRLSLPERHVFVKKAAPHRQRFDKGQSPTRRLPHPRENLGNIPVTDPNHLRGITDFLERRPRGFQRIAHGRAERELGFRERQVVGSTIWTDTYRLGCVTPM
jgi:hypothetical protein